MKIIAILALILIIAGCSSVEPNTPTEDMSRTVTTATYHKLNSDCKYIPLIPTTINFKQGLDDEGKYWHVYGFNNWTDGSSIKQTNYIKLRESNGKFYSDKGLSYEDEFTIINLVFNKVEESERICEGTLIYEFELVDYDFLEC